MEILTKGVQAITPQTPVQNAEDTILKLCDRLEHATLLEDRRAAIVALRNFSLKYRESVASNGLRGITLLLLNDDKDEIILRAGLDTLNNLIDRDDQPDQDLDITGIWIADVISLDQSNINGIISAIDSVDFFTKRSAIQLLTNVLTKRPHQTQNCIVSVPLAISKLVQLLSDNNEAITSDAIYLLFKLVQDNIDISKIVVFENCFEKLLNLLDKNLGLEGGITSLEILNLLHLLLENTSSNRAIFVQFGFMKRISALIQPLLFNNNLTSVSTNQNLNKILNIIEVFTLEDDASIRENQEYIVTSPLFDNIISLTFSNQRRFEICRETGFNLISGIVRSNIKCQTVFEHYKHLNFKSTASIISNSVNTLITEVFNSIYSRSIQMSVINCYQSLLILNRDLQTRLLNEILDRGKDQQDSILSIILNLQDKEQAFNIFGACMVFSGLIRENNDLKIKLGTTKINNDDSFISTLLANATSSLYNNKDPRICSGYLILLTDLIFECRENVKELLHEMPTLRSVINFVVTKKILQREVLGICCTFLLVLYGFMPEENSPISKSELYSSLAENNGRDILQQSIKNFRKSPMIMDLSFYTNHTNERLLVDMYYIEFFKENCLRIKDALDEGPNLSRSSLRKGPSYSEIKLQEALVDLKQKEIDISEQMTRLEELKQLLESEKKISRKVPILETNIKELNFENNQLKEQINDLNKQIAMRERHIAKLEAKDFEQTKQLNEARQQCSNSKQDLEAKCKESKNWMKSFESERAKRLQIEKKIDQLEAKQQKFSNIEQELGQSLQDLDLAKKQNEATTKELNQLAETMKKNSKAKMEIKILNDKLVLELEQSQKKLKDNDDDWMLVMEDLETKIVKLKQQLKICGQAVSSSDEC